MIAHDECLEKLKMMKSLRVARAEIDKKSKELKDQVDIINAEVTEYFEITGQQSIDIDGYGKFYLNREIYPNIEDKPAVEAWLAARGDLDLIKTFNSNKFKAYFKELVEENAELPPTCTQFVKTEVRMRGN